MLKNIGLGYVPVSSIVTGLEIVILTDGLYEMNLVILKKNKQKLSIEKQQQGIDNFEDAAKFIDTKYPVVLILNGKGIIHKKVSITESDNPVTLLNKALPNANPNEFNLQKTPITDTEAFVSVIRTNILNEIFDQLINTKIISISQCFLGPFVIADTLPLISVKAINNEHLTIGNFQLQIKEQRITDLTSSDLNTTEELLIGENRVSPKLIIAFAGAISYFTGNTYGLSNSEKIDDLKEEFSQKLKFEFRAWVLMVATFLILMINYFIFNHYWSKSNEMNAQLLSVESALTHYETLKVEFKEKKDFLEQNGLLENSRTSFYIDKLAEHLPASLQWTEVAVHPLKKKNANAESDVLFFENKTIMVAGNCQNSNELNNWMKEIKNQNWVSAVTMVNYKQDNAKENGVFLIEVKIK